jgi:hypothetical protein
MSSFSTRTADKLFALLPAHIRGLDGPDRLADTDPPGPLQALLRVIEAQADTIDADIEQLLNNAFIETCEPWVIPYIGDLVGTTPLWDDSRVRDADSAAELFRQLNGPNFRPAIGIGNRADVAKTIYYRRRKGTLAMLEELARDVTGWQAHGVAFFERLQQTMWVRNHVRPQVLATPDLRRVLPLERITTAFDTAQHSLDVRRITTSDADAGEGWHGIRNIGLFLWRLEALRLEALDARAQTPAGDFRYRFSVLGNDAPLFTARRPETDAAGLADRRHVPEPLSRATFHADMTATLAITPTPHFSEYYGLFDAFPGLTLAEGRAFMVFIDGQPVPPARIVCRNLGSWARPTGNRVAVDVATGRLTLGTTINAARVQVWCYQGFPGRLGGGPYQRRAWMVRPIAGTVILPVNASAAPGSFASIATALAEWVTQGRPDCIIRVEDNRTYTDALSIEPADGRFLAIEAADGARPHLNLPRPLNITGDHDSASVTLGGLLIEGRITITGSLGTLRLIHTTLVPGGSIAVLDPPAPPAAPQPSITAAATRASGAPANTELHVEAAFSIMGALRLPTHAEALVLLDCAIDSGSSTATAITGTAANSAGPATRIERSTVRGAVLLRQIDMASACIFDGNVLVERQQIGCVRFSFVPFGATTPHRYRCQPDLALRVAREAAGPLTAAQDAILLASLRNRVKPEYTSEAFGTPAYLQLHRNAPAEIATGAEDGSEMGIWCHLKQPQREANLRLRLDEYLPVGLDAGLIRVT